MEVTVSIPPGQPSGKAAVVAGDSGLPKTSKLEAESRAMATIQDDDERMLARIGYKQVGLTLNHMSSLIKTD